MLTPATTGNHQFRYNHKTPPPDQTDDGAFCRKKRRKAGWQTKKRYYPPKPPPPWGAASMRPGLALLAPMYQVKPSQPTRVSSLL